MPSSSRRRRRCRCNRKPPSPAPPAPPETRDWAALPPRHPGRRLPQARALQRDHARRGARVRHLEERRRGEPALWRRADLTAVQTRHESRLAMARAAVDRSAGQCESFSGNLDADSLLYLLERAPSLKSLHLLDTDETDEVINVALKKFPLLEDLEISAAFYNIGAENLLESVCKACPYLKKLRLTLHEGPESFGSDGNMKIYDGGMCAIPITCELRSIELFKFDLTADGLTVIIDNCPVLESLHVSGCFIGNETDEELSAKCARVKDLSLPDLSLPDYVVYSYDSDLDWYSDEEF